HGRLEVRHAAPLRASLEHPLRLADRVVEVLAPGDGETAGLFAVDVLARPRRQDRRRGVPAVAGGDEHGVNVAPRQQLMEVAVGGAVLGLVMFVHELLARLAPARLYIADGQALHVGLLKHRLEVVGATRADADDTQRDALGRGRFPLSAERGRGHEPRSRQRHPRRPPPQPAYDLPALSAYHST